MVEPVSVCPNALMNCTPGNAATARSITGGGMDEPPYVSTRRLERSCCAKLRVVEQLLEHRGNDERAFDTVLLHERHPLARLELVLQHDRASAEHTRERGLQPRDVVQRQRQ